MGITSKEMDALIRFNNEARPTVEVRKIRSSNGERRKGDRRKHRAAAKNYLGMERRIGLDRRVNAGKGRISRPTE